MSDDSEIVEALISRDPLARSYDFFKHLMTLSLLSIGGVFGLISGKNGELITTWMVLLIVGLFGLSALFGLIGLTTITTAELKGEEVGPKLYKQLLNYQSFGTISLSIAVGAFLYAFTKVLS